MEACHVYLLLGFVCWSPWQQQATTGWNSLVQERRCGLENISRAHIDIGAGSKRVKFKIWVSLGLFLESIYR